MKEKMKKIIALVLSLALLTSGIVSGIPGGGVARAEEAETENISAPLGQEMAEWDIGAEIVGEDLAGEPWAEDSSSSAVVEEEGEDDDSSAVDEEEAEDGETEKSLDTIEEEEAEDGEEETLTNTVFGEYDPASAAESGFDKPLECVNDEVAQDGEIIEPKAFQNDSVSDKGSDEFIKSEDLTVEKKNEWQEEEEDLSDEFRSDANSLSKAERLAGAEHKWIYFNKNNTSSSSHDNGYWKSTSTYYIYMWNSETDHSTWSNDNILKVLPNTNNKIFYYDIQGYNNFMIATSIEDWSNNRQTNGISNPASGNVYKLARTKNGTTYPYEYNENNLDNDLKDNKYDLIYDDNRGSGNPEGEEEDADYDAWTADPNPPTAGTGEILIYFDASLSCFVESDQSGAKKEDYVIPKKNDTVYAYFTAKNGSGASNYGVAMKKAIRKNHWVINVNRNNYDRVVFQNVPSGSSPTNPGRTIQLYLPDFGDADRCFFCDSGDPYVSKNSYRQGYWGSYGTIHDPEKRAAVTQLGDGTNQSSLTGEGTYTNYHPSGKSENGIVDKNSTAVRNNNRYYVSATLYDYYSDWEINGQNRDNFNEYSDNSVGDYRIWYQFRQLDRALSAYYSDSSRESAMPLYVGQFQPDFNYNGSQWGIAYKDIHSWFKLYNYGDASGKMAFEAVNNSLKDADGGANGFWENWDGGTHHIGGGFFNYASQGLVAPTLGPSKSLLMPEDSDGTNLLPLFDKSFLEGNNDLNTVLGKVYPKVDFPFEMKTYGGVDYWEYDSNTTSLALKTDSADATKLLLEETATSTSPSWSKNKSSSGSDVDDGKYGFFPFNASTGGKTAKYNYGFGARLDIPFSLPANKKVGDADIVFEFRGDDDVWVFIDGELILDIGGDHAASEGKINFTQGYAYVNQVKKSPSSDSTAAAAGTKAENGTDSGTGKRKSFTTSSVYTSPTTEHTLTMFYMERGMWESNMKVRFNIPTENVFELEKDVDTTNVDTTTFPASLFTDSSIYSFLIRNQTTHYGTKDVALKAVPQTFNDNFTKVSPALAGNTMAQVSSWKNHTNVVKWNADDDDLTSSLREKRYGIIEMDNSGTLNLNEHGTTPNITPAMRWLDFDICYEGTNPSLSNMYLVLVDNTGTAWSTGTTGTGKQKGCINNSGSLSGGKVYGTSTVNSGTWQTIRIDLNQLEAEAADNSDPENPIAGFDPTTVKYILFGCDYSVDIYLDNFIFYSTVEQEGKVGFETKQQNIPDYSTASESTNPDKRNILRNAKGAYYTSSADTGTTTSYQIGADGKVALKDTHPSTKQGERITFSDQFRRGSYLSVVENPENSTAFNNLFETTWKIYNYDNTAAAYTGYAPGTVDDSPAMSGSGLAINGNHSYPEPTIVGNDIYGTSYQGNNDYAGAWVKKADADGKPTTEDDTAIIFRHDWDMTRFSDNVSGVRLLARYENVVQVGSLIISKSQAASSDPLTANNEYEFEVIFTNVGGLALESAPITPPTAIKMQVGGSVTITGIPVGTHYEIREKTSSIPSGERVKVVTADHGAVVNADLISASGDIMRSNATTAATVDFSNTNEPLAEVRLTKTWKDFSGSTLNTTKSDPLPAYIWCQLQKRTLTKPESTIVRSDWTNDGDPFQLKAKRNYDTGYYEWEWYNDLLPARNAAKTEWYEYRVVEVVEVSTDTWEKIDLHEPVYNAFCLLVEDHGADDETSPQTISGWDQGGSNSYTSTLTNQAVSRLKIVKYESGDDDNYLEATFGLYLMTGENVASTPTTTVTTNTTDGIATIDFSASPGIAPGTYRLKEITSPSDHQSQPGYVTVTVSAEGSITVAEGDHFDFDDDSPSLDSLVSPPTLTLNIGNPELLDITANKVFVPALTTGQGTTVYLKLMRKSYNATTAVYDDDVTFNSPNTTAHVNTLNVVAGTDSSFSTQWTGLERYDDNNERYKYYVIETDNTGSQLTDSVALTIATDVTRTYSISNSAEVTPPANSGSITSGLTVTNSSVDALAEKTWSVELPPVNTSVTLKLRRKIAGGSYEDVTGASFLLTRTAVGTVTASFYTISGCVVSAAEDTANRKWTLSVAGLPAADSSGNAYTYQFVEMFSGSPVNHGGQNGAYTVTYTNGSAGSIPDPVSGTNTFTSGITNTREKVSAVLTKEWPAADTNASAIYIKLEKTAAADWNTSNSTVATFTLDSSSINTTEASLTPHSNPDSITAKVKKEGANWVLTVEGMDKYNTSGTAYKFRFVELKASGGADALTGEQVGDYIVTYEGTSNNEIGSALDSNSDGVFTQKITNALARFELTVNKVFKKENESGGDPVAVTGVTETVYIKLMRMSGTETSPDTSSAWNNLTDNTTNPVKQLTSTNSYSQIWQNLERKDSSANFYTYIAVECTYDSSTSSYTAVAAGSTIRLGSRIFTVGNDGTYTVVSTTATTGESTTLTNTLVQPKLDILKVDSGNNNPLEGAVFTLTRTKKYDSSGVLQTISSAESSVTATSNAADGIASFTNSLKDGQYELVETTAPSGYAMHSGKITFTVTNGVLTIGSSAASGLTSTTPDVSESGGTIHFKLTIQNTAGTELPGTGTVFGLSRMGFAGLGTVLLTAFIVLYQYKKRRQYYGEWEDEEI